ncbi:hypothetical protein [Rhodococcus opacus]|nr:hypothetical protein [Rhodococcus opacus]
MDTYDHALLDFALRWSAYGGGDYYIFTEFGIPPKIFYQRVLWMVEKRLASGLDLTMRQQLREHCLAKLTSFQEPHYKSRRSSIVENWPPGGRTEWRSPQPHASAHPEAPINP